MLFGRLASSIAMASSFDPALRCDGLELSFDAASRALYVAEAGNHDVRRIDVDAATIETVACSPGVRGFLGEDSNARKGCALSLSLSIGSHLSIQFP